MDCVVIKKFVPELSTTNVKYEDLFVGNVDDQLNAVKLFGLIDKQRNLLIETLSIKPIC